MDDGKVHPVHFSSRKINSAERNYSTCERETISVLFALRKLGVCLLSDRQFTDLTDKNYLSYEFQKREVHGRLARGMDLLADYSSRMEYRPDIYNGSPNFSYSNAGAD